MKSDRDVVVVVLLAKMQDEDRGCSLMVMRGDPTLGAHREQSILEGQTTQKRK